MKLRIEKNHNDNTLISHLSPYNKIILKSS